MFILWYDRKYHFGRCAMSRNNPELVQELIDGLWTMDQEEFERKYNSLSDSDMSKVARAINRMEKQNERDDLYNTLW